MNNPFTLSFGRKPSEFVSRYGMADEIVSGFMAKNPVSYTYLIEGIRGSGKTVLMTAVEKELNKSTNWIIVDINSTQDILQELATRLYKECDKTPGILKRGFSVSVGGFGVGIEKGSEAPEIVTAIYDMLDMLKKHKKRLLITIDEVMHTDSMRRFASEFQIMLRNDYDCFLLMTGLYENIYSIQNDPALTFLLRSPKIKMTPLSILQITKQYSRIFDIALEEAKDLADITKGYAFAFQAFGRVYFDYRKNLPMEEILSKFDDLLDDFVYKKIWEQLTEKERLIVSNIPEEGTKVGELCKLTGINTQSFSRYRESLKNKGLLDASTHGVVSLILPRFATICQMYL